MTGATFNRHQGRDQYLDDRFPAAASGDSSLGEKHHKVLPSEAGTCANGHHRISNTGRYSGFVLSFNRGIRLKCRTPSSLPLRTMCRWLVFTSAEDHPVALADVLLRPSNSLSQQASDAVSFTPGIAPNPARNHGINKDGHGFGWYPPKPWDLVPIVYRSVKPSWLDDQYQAAVGETKVSTFLGHVRASNPNLPVILECCHPFRYKTMLWQHNGSIGGFAPGGDLQKAILERIGDPEIRGWINSPSDTQHAFALFLALLKERGGKPGEKGNKASLLADTLQETINVIMRLQDLVKTPDEDRPSSFNFCVTDGTVVIATRERTAWGLGQKDGDELPPAPSLYIARGTGVVYDEESKDIKMRHDGGQARMVLISSEPIIMGDSPTFETFGFEVIANDSMVILEPRKGEEGKEYISVSTRDLYEG